MTAYNGNVIRFAVILMCFSALLVSSCKRAGENKEAVREGVIQHLTKNAALDVSQLNVDITDVKFNGNEAVAAVSIKPRSAPDQGMNMTYTLERRGEKWEVKGRGAGHAGMSSGPMGGPPAGAAPEPSAAEGGSHSATPEPKGALGDAPGAGGGALPPGHPPVSSPSPAGKK